MVVAHAFNPSTWKQRHVDLSEYEKNPIYKASSRTARATQKNPVSNKQQNKAKKKQKKEKYKIENTARCESTHLQS